MLSMKLPSLGRFRFFQMATNSFRLVVTERKNKMIAIGVILAGATVVLMPIMATVRGYDKLLQELTVIYCMLISAGIMTVAVYDWDSSKRKFRFVGLAGMCGAIIGNYLTYSRDGSFVVTIAFCFAVSLAGCSLATRTLHYMQRIRP